MAELVTVAQGMTPSQWEAINHFEGPLLVLAGPGSGKTRVLTHRIARLLDRGVRDRSVLAMTFTNKAAREMAERVEQLVPGSRVMVRTFHSFCARMLREWAPAVGLQPNYTIFDTDDQRRLLRQIIKDLDLTAFPVPPAQVGQRISRAKNKLLGPEECAEFSRQRIGDTLDVAVAKIYPVYQQRLTEQNAVDFDDLLRHALTVLLENPELRADVDRRFEFILVDEYQDTNLVQYRILQAMSQDYPNLCVTGDPDQSIYSWRGARLDNILQFEADFPQAQVIRLEHNFRSTQAILRSADRLISFNRHRKHKRLLTHNPEGVPVRVVRAYDAAAEAFWIAERIQSEVDAGRRRYSDFAVLYRVNALSREIESALSRWAVPYQVAAGLSFFERREVKDLLAYVRVLFNPRDDLALARIINVPTRGIGKVTQNKLAAWAQTRSGSLWDAVCDVDNVPGLSAATRKRVKKFGEMMQRFLDPPPKSVGRLLEDILAATGYRDQFADADAGDEEALQRRGNIDELLSLAHQIDEDAAAADRDPLTAFLENTHLASDLDALEDDFADEGDPSGSGGGGGTVTLMSLHAAKGLEFPVVFVVGIEHGLLPHERSLADLSGRSLEEERRLLFVGMTRAEDELVLTYTRKRRGVKGNMRDSVPSEFLGEIEANFEDADGEALHGSRYGIAAGDIDPDADDSPFDDEYAYAPDDDEGDVIYVDRYEDEESEAGAMPDAGDIRDAAAFFEAKTPTDSDDIASRRTAGRGRTSGAADASPVADCDDEFSGPWDAFLQPADAKRDDDASAFSDPAADQNESGDEDTGRDAEPDAAAGRAASGRGEALAEADSDSEAPHRGEAARTAAAVTAAEGFKAKLTTGAALLRGEPDAAEVPQGFAVGMRVRHPRYGSGVIVSISGYSRRRTLHVVFDADDSEHAFVADRCPLQPLGIR